MGSSNLISVGSTLQDLKRAVQKLASLRLNADSTPTFASQVISGLTANRLVTSDTDKKLVSSDVAAWVLEGSSNQVVITDEGDGTITLSTPQNIHTGASPTFVGGTFSAVVTGVIPTAGTHFATKEYVDLALGAFKTFFFSSVGSDVETLNYAYPHETEEDQSTIVTDPALGADDPDPQLIKGFITEVGEPATTTLHSGVIVFHLHAKKGASNQRTTVLNAILSKVAANGTSSKVTIATTENSAELTDTETTYTLHATLSTDVEILSTDRLILDVYASVGSGAQDSVITFYMEGTEDSYFTAEVDSGIWQNHGNVLDDLNTLGAVEADSEFLVGTAAGAFDWESGDTVRTSLGLSIGSNVQAYDAGLTSLASLTYASASFVKMTGANTFTLDTSTYELAGVAANLIGTHESTYNHVNYNTAYSHSQASSGNPHSVTPTELSLLIGTNTQAWDAGLDSLAGLTYAAASFVKMTGVNAFTLRTIGETADDLEGTIAHDNLASPTIAAHDTTATGANLTSLTDNSIVNTLHRHSELVASDGDPDPVLSVDAAGEIGIGLITPNEQLEIGAATGGRLLVSDGGGASRKGFLFHAPGTNAFGRLLTYDYGGSAGVELRINDQGGHVCIGVGVSGKAALTLGGTFMILEQAAADGNHVAYGQLWIKNDEPNILMFTDDAGTDFTVNVTPV